MHEILKFPVKMTLVITEYPDRFKSFVPSAIPSTDSENDWFRSQVAISLREYDSRYDSRYNSISEFNVLKNADGESFYVEQTKDSYQILTEIPKKWLIHILSAT